MNDIISIWVSMKMRWLDCGFLIFILGLKWLSAEPFFFDVRTIYVRIVNVSNVFMDKNK